MIIDISKNNLEEALEVLTNLCEKLTNHGLMMKSTKC